MDPQAHKFAEVWGWRILVGEYFSADYVPAPFQYRWVKTANASEGDQVQAAAGQSQLTNIAWNEKKSSTSRILDELRISAGGTSGKLSIRFNMDAFNETPQAPYFGWGRITGTCCNYRANECTGNLYRNPRESSRNLKPENDQATCLATYLKFVHYLVGSHLVATGVSGVKWNLKKAMRILHMMVLILIYY